MKKTRFLALLVCLVLALGFLPPRARAADEVLYLQWDYKLSVTNLFKLHPIHLDLVLNLTTGKATLDFKRLEEPQYSGYIQEKEKEKEYTRKYKENMSGRVTYDIVQVDLKQGDPRLPACLRYDATMKDGVKWLLTNASGAESVIWDIANNTEHTLLCPYEIWLSPYRDDPNSNFNGQFHSRKDITDPEDSQYIAGNSYFKLADGAPPSAPATREYAIKRDNFSFDNDDPSFFKDRSEAQPTIVAGPTIWFYGTYGYLIDDSAFKAIMAGRTQSQKAELIAKLDGKFEGACYGMSVTSGLLFEERIALNQFGTGADAFSLKAPWENPALARTLAFYQVCGNYDILGYEKRHRGELADSRSTALRIVKSLQSEPEHPVVVGFSASEGSTRYGHAVLAFKVEETSGTYKYDVSVYDPNEPEKACHIYIAENGDASFPSHDNPYFRLADKASVLYDATLFYPAVAKNEVDIRTNEGVTVETNGKSATVDSGKVTGDLDVTAFKPEAGSDETVIIVPTEANQPVRVRRLHPNNGGSASVQTSDTFALISGGANEVTVNPDGSVTAKTNGTEGALAVASDKTKGDLFGTTVETKAGEVTVTPTASGASVRTNGGTADVTVSGERNSVTFEDVDTSKGVDIKSSGNSTTLSSDGQEIAKGTANSSGGTTEAAKPAQPTADKQQISNNATQKAGGNSTQIVDKRRNGGSGASGFRSRHGNVKYSTWAEQEIIIADDFGIIPSALLNKLTGNITRREFAQLVYNTVKAATGMSDADMAKYADKPNNSYASQYSDPAVAFAYGVGIVSGYEDGSFRPENTITREQAAKMLVVMAELLGKMTSESGAKRFNDAPNNWAQTYINKISSVTSPYSGARVMGGDDKGNFSPTGTFTTEQAIATMLRMFESVVGEKSGYSGGVIASSAPATPTQTDTTVPTVADNDQTGYTPKDWSWTAEGEGYGRKYFTSGKYVRRDGLAVIYIESSDSPDGFSYTLFVPASGARQSNYESHDQYGNSFAWAAVNEWNEYHANDRGNGLIFDSIGDGRLEIVSDWIDEMYLQYEAPDGTYYLVREKK